MIEEREAREVTNLKIPVFNPAFDITPANLVTGLITDRGVVYSPNKSKLEDLLS